eukprot:TRINITY_DN2109_c0_g1_i5.p1 TRINITY_DN2109_c0_g1~~TRINITY_DN2109_c0_g1_i5.p1  ORF type:complete len:612 (+),score=83.91 TRINITY_DN2109_c0_g1_i5:565-2400(+)
MFEIIPKAWIGKEFVLDLMGYFTSSSVVIRIAFLQWIIATLAQFRDESREILHNCFSVIFSQLKHKETSSLACRLMCSICQKQHVLPFRASKLNSVIEKSDTCDVWLLKLASVFHQLNPIHANPVPDLEHYDPPIETIDEAFLHRLRSVQEQTNIPSDALSLLTQEYSHFSSNTAKKRKKDIRLIPANTYDKSRHNVAVTAVRDATEIAKNITRFTFPRQYKSLLCNPLFLQPFFITNDASNLGRLFYLASTDLEEIFSNIQQDDNIGDDARVFLDNLINCCEYYSILPNELVLFFLRFVSTWDGVMHPEKITKLLSLLGPMPFVDLYSMILKPLDEVFFNGGIQVKHNIMGFYTTLLRNWSSRYGSYLEKNDFPLGMTKDIFYQSIYQLANHIDRLSYVGLGLTADHPLIKICSLRLAHLLSSNIQEFNLPFVVLASIGHFYSGLLSPYAAILDDTCTICTKYRHEFRLLKDVTSSDIETTVPRGFEKIADFNRAIIDICLGLFKGDIFSHGPKQTFGFRFFLTESDQAANASWMRKRFGLKLLFSTLGTYVEAQSASGKQTTLSESEILDPSPSTSTPNLLTITDFVSLMPQFGLCGIAEFRKMYLPTL